MDLSTPVPDMQGESSRMKKVGNDKKQQVDDKIKSPESPRTSPRLRCPICLGSQENPAKGNECEHIFCFQCLKEWSKVKPECPLCKKSMKKIIYGSSDQKEYVIPVPARSTSNAARASAAWWHHNAQLHAYNQRRISQSNLSAIRESRNTYVIKKRRHYYWKGIRVSYVTNGNRVRNISPQFFRNNQVQTFRLLPWLKRELTVLFGSHNRQIINRCQQLIMSMILWLDIDSDAFYDEIRPYCLQHTEHFIHEFLSFARSPYDLNDYDQHAVYLQNDMPLTHLPSGRPTTSIVPSFLTNQWNVSPDTGTSIPEPSSQSMMLSQSRWDDDDLTTINTRSLHLPTIPTSPPSIVSHSRSYPVIDERQPSSSSMFYYPGSIGSSSFARLDHLRNEASELFPPLNSQSIDHVSTTSRHRNKHKHKSDRKSRRMKRRMNEHRRKDVIVISSSDDEEKAGSSSNQQQQTTTDGTSNDNSGSEIEFVSYIKPPHLRTPDAYIDLDSDGDKPGPSKPRKEATSSTAKPIIMRTDSISSSDSPSPVRPGKISLKRFDQSYHEDEEIKDDRSSQELTKIISVKVKPRKMSSKIVVPSSFSLKQMPTNKENHSPSKTLLKRQRPKSVDIVIEKMKMRKLSLS